MAAINSACLGICHLNAQSLEAHFPDILSLAQNKKLHILAVSESWLKPTRASKLFHIPGYILVRHDRVGKGGGGVALFIHESLQFSVVDQSLQPGIYNRRPEFLFVLLRTPSCKILFGVVYNPPKCGYWSDVEEAFINCNTPYDYSIIVGDFNINWRSSSTPRSILNTFLNSYDLTPLDFQPTHHVGSSHSTIDYICVSDRSKVVSIDQIHCPYISGHDVLFATFSFLIPRTGPRLVTRRSFRNFDIGSFVHDLKNIDWLNIMRMHKLDDKVNFFTTALTRLYDTHAPYCTFVPKRKSPVWLSVDLKCLIKERNKAWRIYKRSRRPNDLAFYKRIRNRVKTLSRNAISSHYLEKISYAKNPSDLWKCVNELGALSNNRAPFVLPTDVDTLNRHFAGVSTPLALRDLRPSVRISPDDQFYFKHVVAADVTEAILSSRSNARGPDDIPVSFLKECLPVILPTLLNIFNCSLQSGVFPSAWKRAMVCPLPKKSPPLDFDHLRPISILCSTAKILERVAGKQILEFIARNNLLDSHQSGFRKHYSTHTALVTIVDDIRQAIDEGKLVLLVAIDFSRAFDLVNISLLVHKLISFGFSDSVCSWVNSYLSNRSQVVVSPSGEVSSAIFRNSGVPQGSPNSPAFFSLAVNDAPVSLKHSKHHLYADDFTFYCKGSFHELEQLVGRVNEDLNGLAEWATANGLNINTNKTHAIWFGSRGFISRLQARDLPHLSLDGQQISYCDSVKILGLTLDSTLSWSQSCTATSKKCFAALSRLRKCRDMIPRATKLLLVKTLVFPYLDYCAGVQLDLSQELCLKLQRCKNAAVRFATGTSRFDHITPAYTSNSILSFARRRDLLIVCTLANILKHGEPGILRNKFSFRPEGKSGSKRCSHLDLVVDFARTSCYMHSFAIGAARIWNGLPVELRTAFNRPCFKHLLSSYFLQESRGAQ